MSKIKTSDINATGTPGPDTYLAGDGSWKTPAGGGSSSSGGWGESPWIKPSVSSFTTRNGATGVITDTVRGVRLQATGSSTNVNDLTYCVQPLITAGSGGRMATGRFRRYFPLTQWAMTGMLLRDSVGGRSRLYSLGNDSVVGFNRNQFTNDTTFNSVSAITENWHSLDFWMRIIDNLTDHIIQVSQDGEFFQTIFQENRTTWMTPNQVGFHLNPNMGSTFPSSANLRRPLFFECVSWQQQPL